MAFVAALFGNAVSADYRLFTIAYGTVNHIFHKGGLSMSKHTLNAHNDILERLMMNIRTHRIFSDKMRINVLCLNQLENATQEERSSGLYEWAKTFKATTWEELKNLSKENDIIRDTVVTMAQLSDDEKIREQCQRREKYERDQISAHNSGKREGLEEGQNMLATLLQQLLKSRRQEDCERAINDSAYRNELLREYDFHK